MRIFGFLLLASSLTMLILYLDGWRRWRGRPTDPEDVTDEWLDKLARDLRTHQGSHWRS